MAGRFLPAIVGPAEKNTERPSRTEADVWRVTRSGSRLKAIRPHRVQVHFAVVTLTLGETLATS